MICSANSPDEAVPGVPRGALRTHVPMATHTAWGLGGKVDRAFEPANLAALGQFLAGLPSTEPLLWVGLGSNLLVRDAGVRGTVIFTARALRHIELLDATRVRVESGVPSAKLARFTAAHSLVGGEFFAGIPGTVGGALAMNAGAFGGETWPLVRTVETIDRAGEVRCRAPADFEVAYRHVRFPQGSEEEWFVAAILELSPGEGGQARANIRSLLKRRAASQPTGQRSCGSVFKNPPNDFAGRLIDTAGLKGTRIGGARVSHRHANFIINDGSATAADVEALIDHVGAAVEAFHGICLAPEVRIVGERAAS